MRLSETQIKNLLRSPKHNRELEASKLHHQRLAFHSDIVLRKEHASKYYATFTAWIGELLPSDKKDRIESLLTFPLCTNELMKDVFMGLERVWRAKNYTECYTFISTEYESEFMAYLKKIRSDHMWKVEAWSSLKTCIDTVVIIDLPEEQTEARPQPYFYFIAPEEIIDLSVSEKNDMEYIMFVRENPDGVNDLIVYDSELMRKYEYKDRKQGRLLGSIEHGLGYCPARMMWSDKLQDGNYINKRSPVTDSLGDLDWLLFFKTSKKYLDMHAAYPIYVTYEIKSENENDAEKLTEFEGQHETKSHKGKGFLGPGTFTTVPPPGPGEQDMMSNPVQVVPAEIDACKYSAEEVSRLEKDIYQSCVGINDVLQKEAVNEDQVDASLISAQDVLRNLARNFSEIILWTNETLALLQYGDTYFTEGMVSFGEDFYLESESDLMEQYADAKQKGINPVMLDSLDEKLLDSIYKNDRRGRMKAAIFKDLDPLPGMTIQEASALIGKGVTVEDLTIKANLLKFVKMFELEHGDVIDFEDGNYAKKINGIKLKFKDYVSKSANDEGE